jgi:hypothetical protein
VDDGGVGASPLRKRGVGTGWGIPKRGTGDDLEEVVAHLLEIRLEFLLWTSTMKVVVTAEIRPAYSPRKTNQRGDQGGCGREN